METIDITKVPLVIAGLSGLVTYRGHHDHEGGCRPVVVVRVVDVVRVELEVLVVEVEVRGVREHAVRIGSLVASIHQ
mgnify:FL=1